MYRPQFSFPPPQDGTYDEDFVYSFDPYNTPALDVRFGPAERKLRIPLQMQADAAFIHRGLRFNPTFTSYLGARLYFPDDSPLTDDLVPLSAFAANTGNPVPPLEGGDEGQGMIQQAGASYQVDIVNRSATQSALPLFANINPVLVDPVGFGIGPNVNGGNPSTNTFGPFLYNGGLYMFLIPTVPSEDAFQAFQSLDGGATWRHVGTVGEPTVGNAAPIFDGNHTVIVAVSTAAEGTSGTINLVNFDLSTLTWGPVYATAGAPTTEAVTGIFIRPDGTYIVLHNPRAAGPGTGSGLFAAVYNPTSATWVTNFDAGTGIAALSGYNVTTDFSIFNTAVLDSSGNLHVFFTTTGSSGPPNWLGRVFYQQIESSNALGTFFDFPGNDTTPTKITSVLYSNAVIVGNSVLLSIQQFDAGLGGGFYNVVVGSPLSAPVFSYAPEPGIDPNAFFKINPNTDFAPYMFYDGRTLFAIATYTDQDGNEGAIFRLLYTNTPATPSSGWSSVEIWNYMNDGRFNNILAQVSLRPSMQVVGDTIYLSVELSDPFEANARYYLGTITIVPVRIQLRGVKRYVRTKRAQSCAK